MSTSSNSLTNTSLRYGTVAKWFHWLTAALILTLIPLGFVANRLAQQFQSDPESANIETVTTLFSVHKTLGVTVFFLALGRIFWALMQPKPKLLHGDRKVEAFAAELVHWLLYISLVAVPLTGWIHHAATSGFAPIWWPLGQSLPLVPQSAQLADLFSTLHFLFVILLVSSLSLHIAGALKHHVIDRDATLRRMLPGRTEADVTDRQPRHWPAALMALVLALLPFGAALSFGPTATAPIELRTAESQWQVTKGTLDIAIVQLGSNVAGRFDQWTAAIQFDPHGAEAMKGNIDVQIAIASLALGSVRDQAMGPDYFDTNKHPTAQYKAVLVDRSGTLMAEGQLTLKGATASLSFPVNLTLSGSGQEARATGDFVLDRRSFAIGTTVPDAATLGFDVQVRFDLTAALASS